MNKYKELLQLLKTKNKDLELIITFKSSFFGNGEPWLYSTNEDIRQLLWLEELKHWLLLNKHALIDVTCIDNWDSYNYRIFFPDSMSPFLEPDNYNKNNEFESYLETLLEGVLTCCKLLINDK